jgi:hypothetical protein
MVSAIAPLVLAASALLAAAPAVARCNDLVPTAPTSGAIRDITANDLVRLRDIGDPDSESDDASPLALSPDRKRLAFVLSRGDPVDNEVCRAMVVVSIDDGAPPTIVDRGGDLPIGKGIYRGMFVRSGYPDVTIPAWSPDGRWVAYIKRIDGIAQLWRARADGSGAEAILRLPVDVETFGWSPDGTHVAFTSRPAIVTGERALDHEARSGYLYDGRATPDTGIRPNLRADDVPLITSVLDLATGETRATSGTESKWLAPDYVAVYASAYGSQEPVAELIPAMLNGFLDSDREFAKSQRGGPATR